MMKSAHSTKCHYKMYKQGRFWVFAGVLVASFEFSKPAVQADTAADEPVKQSAVTTTASTVTAKSASLTAPKSVSSATSSAASGQQASQVASAETAAPSQAKSTAASSVVTSQETSEADTKTVEDNATKQSVSVATPAVNDDGGSTIESEAAKPKDTGSTPKSAISGDQGHASETAVNRQDVVAENENLASTNDIDDQESNHLQPLQVAQIQKTAAISSRSMLAVASVPVTDVTASPDTTITAQGICGPDTTWYVEDQVLHISGGQIGDYDKDGPYGPVQWPWGIANQKLAKKIIKVVFDDTVKAPKNCKSMFENLSEVTEYENLDNLDVSNVQFMNQMFASNTNLASIDLSNWDMGQVTGTVEMFRDCNGDNFKVVSLPKKSAPNIYSASNMFADCPALVRVNFNGIDLGMITIKVGMFGDCGNLSGFDVSTIRVGGECRRMFSGCLSLEHLNIEIVTPPNSEYEEYGTGTSGMFYNCQKLETLTIVNQTPQLIGTSADQMFTNCYSLKNTDFLNKFIPSADMSIAEMFANCRSLTELDLTPLKQSRIRLLQNVVAGCTNLETLNLGSIDTSLARDMRYAFAFCPKLTHLDLSTLDTSSVTNMSGMFMGDVGLSALDLSQFNTDNLTDMSLMFANCQSLTALDLSSFKPTNLSRLEGAFANCTSLATLDGLNFDTHQVANFNWVFDNDQALRQLDLSSWNMTNQDVASDVYVKDVLKETMPNLRDRRWSWSIEYVDDTQVSRLADFLGNTTALTKLTLGPNAILKDDFGDAALPTEAASDYAGQWIEQRTPKQLLSPTTLMATYQLAQAPTETQVYLRLAMPTLELKAEQLTLPVADASGWSTESNFVSGTDEFGNALRFADLKTTVTPALKLDQPGTYLITYEYQTQAGQAKISRTATLKLVVPVVLAVKSNELTFYIGPNTMNWQPVDNLDLTQSTDTAGQLIDPSQLSYRVMDKSTGVALNQLDMTQPGQYQIDYLYQGKLIQAIDLTLLTPGSMIDANDVQLIADPKTRWTVVQHQPVAIDEAGKPVKTINVSIVDLQTNQTVSTVNTQVPGRYELTFSFIDGTQQRVVKNAMLTIVANQAAIKTKDSQLTVGDTWQAGDNWLEATDYLGHALTLADMQVTGTVNTQKAGKYTITYTYSRNSTLTPTVVTAMVTVVAQPVTPEKPGTKIPEDPEPEVPEPEVPQPEAPQPEKSTPITPVPADHETAKPTDLVSPTDVGAKTTTLSRTTVTHPVKDVSTTGVADGKLLASGYAVNNQAAQLQKQELNGTSQASAALAKSAQAATTLPQTTETSAKRWLSWLGLSLLGLLSLVGVSRKSR